MKVSGEKRWHCTVTPEAWTRPAAKVGGLPIGGRIWNAKRQHKLNDFIGISVNVA